MVRTIKRIILFITLLILCIIIYFIGKYEYHFWYQDFIQTILLIIFGLLAGGILLYLLYTSKKEIQKRKENEERWNKMKAIREEEDRNSPSDEELYQEISEIYGKETTDEFYQKLNDNIEFEKAWQELIKQKRM